VLKLFIKREMGYYDTNNIPEVNDVAMQRRFAQNKTILFNFSLPSGGKNSELEKNSELATRDRGEIGRSTDGFEAFIAVR